MSKKPINLFRSEWKHLFKNKMLLISCLVILFIPIMYGGFFLGSIWDPYNETENLPVAVVNEDTGSTLNGENINIGGDVISELKNDNNLNWHFVSSEEAESGMKNNEYYMKVTIPSDFSSNAASITSNNPDKSVIKYTVAASKNYIGTVIDDEAISRLKSSVSSQISKAYVSAIMDSIASLTDGISQITTGQASLYSGMGQLKVGSAQLKSAVAQINSSLPSSTDIDQLKTGLNTVANGLDSLNTRLASGSDYSQLVNDLTSVGTNLTNIGGLTYNESVALSSLASQISTSDSNDTQKANMLAVISSLSGYINQQGSNLQTASVTLDDNNDATTSDVTGQLSLIERQSTALTKAVSDLNSGMQQINPAAQKALSGLNSLSSGIGQISTGLNSLDDNLGLLLDGSGIITKSLNSVSSQLEMQSTSEQTVEQITNPVTTEKTNQGDVANYGHALAPYVLSLGLFVGALVFNFIYPIRKTFGQIKNGLKWWLSKFSVGFAVAILQATILDLIMVLCLGLRPDNMLEFYIMTYATSCAYMAIVMFLSMTFNNPGRFVAMVLLVLQLGGSGGTFPLELSNSFFQTINPYLPMTYSILGLRQAISSGLGIGTFWSSLSILAILFIFFNGLILLVLSLKHKHGFAPDPE